MDGKHYVGKRAQSFEQYEDVTVDGVRIVSSDNRQFTAGNQDGYVLDINCPYGTQQMANDLFAMLGGHVYRGYRATNAVLDPMAELGDGVTINGVYSNLAYRRVNFGPNHASEIAAPGESTLNHEYNYVSPTQREIDKKAEESQKQLEEFAKNFTEYLELIKKQADAKAETWYQADDPSTGWSTEQKKEHAGDLWYNTSDSNFYIYNGTVWEKSQTTPPDYVFDQIDKKAQIFTSQPVPPYNEKDLWFAGENAPIKVCVKARGEGERFVDSDWQKKDQYIDQATADKAASDAVDGQTQEDIFNKLTDNGAKQGLMLDEKTGDVYINAKYLRGDTIDLNLLRLTGTKCGLMQGNGMIPGGETTEGIVMYGNGVDRSGIANPPYIIVTNAGIRGQSDEDHSFNMAAGEFEVKGNITTAGSVTSGTHYALNGNYAIRDNDGQLWIGNSISRNVYLQGSPLYINESGLNTYLRGNVYFSDAYVLDLLGNTSNFATGAVSVLCNAGVVSSAHITFPSRFTKQARVAAISWGTNLGTFEGISVTGIDEFGFTINVLRTNTVSTDIFWIAARAD